MAQTSKVEDGYLSALEAGRQFGYTNDYIARLAREKKVLGTRVGRQWFVDAKSLEVFVANTEDMKRQNAEKVRQERLRERVSVGTHGATVEVLPVPHSRAFTLAKTGMVMCASVAIGAFFYTSVILPDVSMSPASLVDALRGMAVKLYSMGSEPHTMPAAASVSVNTDAAPLSSSNENTIAKDAMVVLPPHDTRSNEDIAASFSDEVTVTRAKDGKSGVVTPHFKSKNDTAYRFLLVPLEN